MKEFIKSNRVTYNLMSFTAFKTLLIFSLLLESPRSYQDIITYFETHDFINEKVSIDTIRVYLNSLKRAGCVIEKTKRSEGSKFILKSHPFELSIADEEIKPFIKVYKTISKTISIKELILLEKFLRKISYDIENKAFQTSIEKYSLLSGIDIDLLEDLLKCCELKKQITLSYHSPKSGIKDLEIICDKVDFENGKLYIYGSSIDFNQSVYLLINRINKIKEIKLKQSTNIKLSEIKIQYKIKTSKPEIQIKDNEKIISTDDNYVYIEATTSNRFAMKQRILSFGNACTVLAPEDFRQEIIATLKNMRAEY